MNFLAVRLVLWFVTLAMFPIPAALVPLSFQVEVLQRITFAAPPEGRPGVELTEKVLKHLEQSEKTEIDPWYRDDLRIAWITALWSQRGVPAWSLHANQPAYVAATWQVLHCHPDQVWPRILAAREGRLGKIHSQFFAGAPSSPRKPVRSVGIAELERLRAEQRKRAA